jgi:hypothetical protein
VNPSCFSHHRKQEKDRHKNLKSSSYVHVYIIHNNNNMILPNMNHNINNTKNNNLSKLYKKLVYSIILILIICIVIRYLLITITSSSSSSSSSSIDTQTFIYVLLQYHEPSIRIFRCLYEIILLLICTFLSICIYIHYISYNITNTLLFQSIYNNDDDDENDADDDDEKLFHDPHSDDHDHEHDIDDEDDKANLIQHPSSNNNNVTINHEMDGKRQDISLYDVAHSIANTALDLFIYTCITLILYVVSTLQTIRTTTTTTTTTATNISTYMNIITTIVSPPTFPFVLVLFCIIRCIQYRKRYIQFYTILSYTIYAPYYNLSFRDGMIVRIYIYKHRFPVDTILLYISHHPYLSSSLYDKKNKLI